MSKARGNERMDARPAKSRQTMEEELVADKRDDTCPLTSSKKAEVYN